MYYITKLGRGVMRNKEVLKGTTCVTSVNAFFIQV